MGTGDRRRETGDRRWKAGEEKGGRQLEMGDRRREAEGGRWETGDMRQEPLDGSLMSYPENFMLFI